jgi:hypothetical protein
MNNYQEQDPDEEKLTITKDGDYEPKNERQNPE